MSTVKLVKKYQTPEYQNLVFTKKIDDFNVGDTIAVKIKIVDGASERITTFQGICIKKRAKGLLSSCVVRKLSAGIGVERTIFISSPLIVEIAVVKRGDVRRANLAYLRNLKGALKVKELFDAKLVAAKKQERLAAKKQRQEDSAK
jgi:large subunit ribosomal protein L19